jgi:phosphatidylglycerol---prolipoprotein diacylglyceryl transferase
MSLAITIFATIFIIGGVGSYAYFFMKKFYDFKEQFDLKFLKSNILYLAIPGIILLIGFYLAQIAYFTNGYIINYLSTNSITISSIDIAYIILGTFFFIVSLWSFFTILFIRMYLKKIDDKKASLIMRISQYVSVVGAIGFFIMMMQGNAAYLIYPLANQITFSSKGILLEYRAGKSQDAFFSIALYAIFIISGACLVLYICDYKLFKIYGQHGLITVVFFIAFPCGIIGARAWYVIGEWSNYVNNPLEMFAIWDGGLAIMGGAVFGIITGVVYLIIMQIKSSRYKAIDYLVLVDIVVPTILVAQGIGRIGNFFNCEVHGNAVDIANWMWIPTFIRNNMHYSSSGPTLGADKIYMPLFFIEAIINFAGYFFIEYGIMNLFGIKQRTGKDYHANGSLVGWYLAWYGATRAILEPLRYSAYNMGDDGMRSVVSSYVMIGVGLFIVAIFIVLKVLNLKGKFKYPRQRYLESHKNDNVLEESK